MLKRGVTVKKEYNIHFKVFPKHFSPGWHNVLHFTTGRDLHDPGSRIPGVWFFPNGKNQARSLHICSDVNEEVNTCFNSHMIPRNEWTQINIKQELINGRYMYQILINHQLVHEVENQSPRMYKNVTIYAGDPFYSPQPGSMKDLIYTGGKNYVPIRYCIH